MQIRQIVAGAKHKEMVFGDRFPLRYFTDAYGLTYRAASVSYTHLTLPTT